MSSIAALLTACFSLPLGAGQTAHDAYLKPQNAGGDDTFGLAVAASGDTLVVGAPREGTGASGVNPPFDNNAPLSGAAYVFVRDGSTWTQQALLKASNVDPGDLFGSAVAIDGNLLVVGAMHERGGDVGVNGDEADNSLFEAGAAYVFARSGSTWTQQAYLKASAPDQNDEFGDAVAVSGSVVLVGAPKEDSDALGANGDPTNDLDQNSGAVYAFVRTGSTWAQEAYLKSSEPSEAFGSSVALCGEIAAIGARFEHVPSHPVAGAVYVLARTGTTWSTQARLSSSEPDEKDNYGASVSIFGDTLAVGVPFEDSGSNSVNGDPTDNGTFDAGAAFVYTRSGTTWTQQAYIKASNSDPNDRLGESLALYGDRLVIGAARENGGATGINGDLTDDSQLDAGAAYVYARSGTTWSQQAYLKASNTGFGDRFGASVAIAADWIVIGAPREDSNAKQVDGNPTSDSAPNAGAVYAFAAGGPPTVYCTAKPSSAGCVSSISTSLSGAQPISGAGDYAITAAAVQDRANGILFGSTLGAVALPFLGGVLCVQPPVHRGPIQSAGGNDPTGCSGSFFTLVNDGQSVPNGFDAGRGQSAWYQYWYRDPGNGPGQLGSALSNAVRLDFL